ncbi:MAG: UDP-N-acetylmuramoyl-L-alanyl-D-glutamate--2,6-diaminopimelate ligase [Burkholderiaceae bacterium]|nr:UDP-N-acetylmuramoyl-L-alanyl-D-glutamate--2,6-diaminopimelate ligase [Burkholderiaceae bacterium]
MPTAQTCATPHVQLHTAQDVVDWLRARDVRQLCGDSRRVQAGDAFVAWPGYALDARGFVAAALSKGAVCAVAEAQDVETSALPASLVQDPRVALVSDLKAMCGEIAALFEGQPSAQLDVVAVTGTNGKTSITWWLAQALSAAGSTCGLVGTLGVGRTDALVQTGLTTPDPIRLQHTLADFSRTGLTACAMEASSIGLQEHRLSGTHIKVAVFSNLSQDHLDYHDSMHSYWLAKRSLFAWPQLQAAVVNTDDAHGAALVQELRDAQAQGGVAALDLWTVGIDGAPGSGDAVRAAPARLQARNVRPSALGLAFDVQEYASGACVQTQAMDVRMLGQYNVSNMLCVLASMRALGIGLADAVAACANLHAVPGRMELVDEQRSDIRVLVDYAHTPDAVAQALQALRPIVAGNAARLWCVLGCGGDRDASKRAPMAQLALEHADAVVFTSDNPRSEDPQTIVDQLMSAALAHDHAHSKTVLQQVDRAQAIAMAVAKAGAGDVVLIAGKGHEDYQEVAGVRTPFSDVQVARAALRSLRAGATL